jgi:hypothetical protein
MQSARNVTTIISEIADASQEQTRGIQQITQAIGEMDNVTQQNSALVEEVASASESLVGQATDLSRVVGAFKIDGDMSRAVSDAHKVVASEDASAAGFGVHRHERITHDRRQLTVKFSSQS